MEYNIMGKYHFDNFDLKFIFFVVFEIKDSRVVFIHKFEKLCEYI